MNQVKVTERVQKQLFELQDLQYRDFQAKLLPTIEKETVIGVRMPVLRKFAKGYGKSSGYIYRRGLPLDGIRSHLYNPIRHRYADALLSGRRIPDRISQESSFGSVRRILCEYDAGMVFCNRARKAV